MPFDAIPTLPSADAWASLMEEASASTIFHSAAWISPLKALTTVVVDGHTVVAGICAPIGLDEQNRPPMMPYAGPLLTDEALAKGPDYQRRVHRVLSEWIRAHYPHLRFCTSPWAPLHPCWVTAGFRFTLMYTHELDIEDPATLQARFAPTLRSNLRRVERDGFTVTSTGSLAHALALARSNFTRIGQVPWYDETYLTQCLHSAISLSQARVFETLDPTGIPRAGVVIVWDSRRAYYLIGGLDRDHAHRGSLALALRAAMEFVREANGLTRFDLEGSNQPAIAAAFARYGGEAKAYYYVQHQEGNVFDG